MNKIKLVAILGKSGSGKNTLLTNLQDTIYGREHLYKLIPVTTRPRREYEKDGVDYYFISIEEFTRLMLEDRLLTFFTINDWFYGVRIDDVCHDEKIVNIGIFTPFEINCLLDEQIPRGTVDLMVIYVDANDKERLMRQLSRENDPDVREILRRYQSDDRDYTQYELEDFNPIIVTNNAKSDILANSLYLERAIMDKFSE